MSAITFEPVQGFKVGDKIKYKQTSYPRSFSNGAYICTIKGFEHIVYGEYRVWMLETNTRTLLKGVELANTKPKVYDNKGYVMEE